MSNLFKEKTDFDLEERKNQALYIHEQTVAMATMTTELARTNVLLRDNTLAVNSLVRIIKEKETG